MKKVKGIKDFLNEKKLKISVADIGCYGWKLNEICKEKKAKYVGFDRIEPPKKPKEAQFLKMSNAKLESECDAFDAIVVSHVLEHLNDPVELMKEVFRITKPGGEVWVECPSEESLQRKGSEDHPEDHSFGCFWDDPTHIRPHTPGSLYRLALSVGFFPLAISRSNESGMPCVRMIAKKFIGISGGAEPRYVTLKDIPEGAENAWKAIWPQWEDLIEKEK